MTNVERHSVITLGKTAKGARVWLEGKWMLRGGFEPEAKYSVEISHGCVRVELADDGRRKVAAKRGIVPVIDLQNAQIAEAFGSAEKLEVVLRGRVITISPARTEQLVAARRASMTEGSLFSGGGLLTEAARQAGFEARFAVELVPEYAEIFEANHPTATVYNCSVEQVATDELRKHGPLGLLTIGIPCEPYSNIRSLDRVTGAKRDRSLPPEAHEAGDMVFWSLRAIDACNPSMVVIENVPAFLNSAAYYILRHAMQRLGYTVDARVVNSSECGSLTERKRAIVIAKTAGAIVWPDAIPQSRTLAEILEPVERGEWFDRTSKPWLFEHWDRQTAKGNGFASQIVRYDSPKIGTIKKRYFAGQGDNPVVAHPTLEGVYRWLTVAEVKRLHGLADGYFLGDSKTRAGEVMGQGVVVDVLARIIAANVECAKVEAAA